MCCLAAHPDDFGGPPQQQQQQQQPAGPFLERNVGASLQSLPPRPLALPPSISTIQHSLSLNGEGHSHMNSFLITSLAGHKCSTTAVGQLRAYRSLPPAT